MFDLEVRMLVCESFTSDVDGKVWLHDCFSDFFLGGGGGMRKGSDILCVCNFTQEV